VPSGKFDSAIFMPNNDVVNGGEISNMLIDARDVGRITVELLKREDTLNKTIVAYGEVMSQNEIHQMIEARTGEKLVLTHVCDRLSAFNISGTGINAIQTTESEARARLQAVKEKYDADPTEGRNRFLLAAAQYAITKYVRADNTPENAEYLGYIDARKLLPDFKYRTFGELLDDLMAGGVRRPYEGVMV
jgi:hypothetical protein